LLRDQGRFADALEVVLGDDGTVHDEPTRTRELGRLMIDAWSRLAPGERSRRTIAVLALRPTHADELFVRALVLCRAALEAASRAEVDPRSGSDTPIVKSSRAVASPDLRRDAVRDLCFLAEITTMNLELSNLLHSEFGARTLSDLRRRWLRAGAILETAWRH